MTFIQVMSCINPCSNSISEAASRYRQQLSRDVQRHRFVNTRRGCGVGCAGTANKGEKDMWIIQILNLHEYIIVDLC